MVLGIHSLKTCLLKVITLMLFSPDYTNLKASKS